MNLRKINKRELLNLVLLIIDIVAMILCSFHVFNNAWYEKDIHSELYILVFLLTFIVYGIVRYKDEVKIIGKHGVSAMLLGLVLALYGCSNMVSMNFVISYDNKTGYLACFLVGVLLYGYYDYKSNKYFEGVD